MEMANKEITIVFLPSAGFIAQRLVGPSKQLKNIVLNTVAIYRSGVFKANRITSMIAPSEKNYRLNYSESYPLVI